MVNSFMMKILYLCELKAFVLVCNLTPLLYSNGLHNHTHAVPVPTVHFYAI